MGADKQNNDMNQTRQPQQQSGGMSQQNPSQQQQQKDKMGQSGSQSGQRIDTDNDGRTRDPNDKRPSDQGGKAPPVQR